MKVMDGLKCVQRRKSVREDELSSLDMTIDMIDRLTSLKFIISYLFRSEECTELYIRQPIDIPKRGISEHGLGE